MAHSHRSYTADNLVEYSTATRLAEAYARHTVEISRLIVELGAEVTALRDAFRFDDTRYGDFDLRVASHSSYRDGDSVAGESSTGRSNALNVADKYCEQAKLAAWKILVDKLGVRKLMSAAREEELRAALNGESPRYGEAPREPLPDITPENIRGTLLGMCGSAEEFVNESIAECWNWLRPAGWQRSEYKTNQACKYAVKSKVIITMAVERLWNCWQANYHRSAELNALDNVFHWLDGAGIPQGSPLLDSIKQIEDNAGETAYFKFRCFHNHSLHLWFKRADLLAEFNRRAGSPDRVGAND